MKRICVIHHVNKMGGGSKSLIDVLEMLRKDFSVIACIPSGESVLKRELEIRNIEIYEVKNPIGAFPYYSGGSNLISRVMLNSVKKMKYVRKVAEEIEKLSPDIILFNTIVTSVMAPYFSEKIKKVCIVRETFKGTLWDNIYKVTLNNFHDAVCFIAKHELDYIHLNKRIKQMVLPDCVDPKLINWDKKVVTDDYQLLYLGGFPKLKGLDVLLEAMYRLKNQSINLTIAGYFSEDLISNEAFFRLHSLSQYKYILKVRYYYYKLKNLNKIKILGYRTDIDNYLRNCDVVIFPSTKPHQPRPAIEAGEYYKPVIITDYEATKEYFINNYNCLTFKPGDSVDLASKIMSLYTNPEFGQILGEHNHKMTTELHNYDITKKKFLEFIKSV